jgi:ribosomal protein L7Ae-like RNA K-turn-binding protein
MLNAVITGVAHLCAAAAAATVSTVATAADVRCEALLLLLQMYCKEMNIAVQASYAPSTWTRRWFPEDDKGLSVQR